MDERRYPIGHYHYDGPVSEAQVAAWIDEIEAFPAHLRDAVEGLSAEQSQRTYRPGGWTVQQVVHHVGDSHLNALLRFKWALTEDTPAIKPYYEDRWATLGDFDLPVAAGVAFIEQLHRRLVALLRSLTPAARQRKFIHPEMTEPVTIEQYIGLYAWHGKHHLAHIQNALQA